MTLANILISLYGALNHDFKQFYNKTIDDRTSSDTLI